MTDDQLADPAQQELAHAEHKADKHTPAITTTDRQPAYYRCLDNLYSDDITTDWLLTIHISHEPL